MRVPHVWFTIGRLMFVVLLVGLALWGRREIQLRQLNQRIIESRVQASYQQARLVREVAEYAVKEYELGIDGMNRVGSGTIRLAKQDKERAIGRLKWSTEMSSGYVSKASINADKLTVERANLEQREGQRQLKCCPGTDFQQEVIAPAAIPSPHGHALAAGKFLGS